MDSSSGDDNSDSSSIDLTRSNRRLSTLNRRFHPYSSSSSSLTLPSTRELICPTNMNDRLDVLDSVSSRQCELVQYLRRYEEKRVLVRSLCLQMNELEQKIGALRNTINDDFKRLEKTNAIPTNTRPPPPPASSSSSSSSSSSIRVVAPPPPAPIVLDNIIEEEEEEEPTIISTSQVYRIDNTTYSHGVTCLYFTEEAKCTLCEEKFEELYQCTNDRCIGRICGICLNILTRKDCPWCNSHY
jgi:hypothetical protein